MNLRCELEAVLRCVARDEVMPRFTRVEAMRKPDGSFLTEADLACQRALERLLPDVVNCPVLGEEMSPQEQVRLWQAHPEALWVVDPIDGTTNFAHGLPLFSISAALLRQGRAVLGVTFLPALDECYGAVDGGGAFLNDVPLFPKSAVPELSAAVAAVETKRLPSSLAMQVVAARPFHSLRNVGAGTIDWCWLAAGRFDLLLHGGQKLWDYAAGTLIAREAGCVIGGIGADFDAQAVWQRSALAARNPTLFASWQAWVEQHGHDVRTDDYARG